VRSALAEAAYMIGLERRPEVVRLASYAPLLARSGHTQWTPDLIYFNADEVLPSASYHVQRMFGSERGTRVHPVELEGVQPVPVALPEQGRALLRSDRATVAYTGVVLDGNRLPDVITRADGEGVLLGVIDPGDTELEFEAVQEDGIEGFTVVLGPEAPQSHLAVNIGGWQNKSTAVARSDDGIGENDDGPLPWRGIRTGEPVRMRIRLSGPRVQVWVDGELRHDYEQDLRPEQRVVAGALSRAGLSDGAGEYVVRLVNATATARTAAVELPEPGPVTAAVRLLAGAGPDEGRPHEASPVAPVDSRVEGDSGFDLALPPWSFATAVVRPLG
jgi:hypothetical protein